MPKRVVMARLGAPFGVRGWIRVHSEADPPESLFDFEVWCIGAGERPMRVVEHAAHAGNGFVVRLEGIDDRERAAALRGMEVAVDREAFAALPEETYYWADLIGLKVLDTQDRLLGRVERLMETGANDVLIVRGERERLIPFLRPDVVKTVDLAAGELRVDWDPDF